MKKTSSYSCHGCGYISPKWLGNCPECKGWNTFEEQLLTTSSSSKKNFVSQKLKILALNLKEVPLKDDNRFTLNFKEMDRVLGGGVVLGSAVLVGGEPGIGKSTLLLQVAHYYKNKGKVLYVSGEESISQIKMRAKRLKIDEDHIYLTNQVEIETLKVLLESEKPECIIIDSIQTLFSHELDSPQGSPSQLKFSSLDIIEWSKAREISLFLIGHITKEGSLAGPKVIEHMVDTVLYFEKTEGDLRVVRATKNRFGSIDEMGFFFMEENGLRPLDNLSEYLYSFKGSELPQGVALTCLYEGSRAILIEIQALTIRSSSGVSRIFSDRVDSKRISRLCAVLEKHIGLSFSDQDIYINISGGLYLRDIATDLALLMALYSARTSLSLRKEAIFMGEVSLTAEVKRIHHIKSRLKTAQESSIKFFIGPSFNEEEKEKGYFPISSVQEAIEVTFKIKD